MSNLKLIFLGTGDAFNSGGLANNSLLIQYKYGNLLFDAGPTSFYQMLKLGFFPENINFIFITHFHGDHTAGIPFFLLYLKKKILVTKLPIIIGPAGIKDICRILCENTYKGSGLLDGVTIKELPVGQKKDIALDKGLSFDIIPMKHSPESIAYRLSIENRVIAVSGDTGINDNLLSLIHNTDASIIECSFEQRGKKDHISLEDLKEYISYWNSKRIIPVHTSKKIQEKIKELQIEKILSVTDGDIIDI